MKLTKLILLLVVFSFACSKPTTTKKPNVLFLFIDDYSYNAVHAMGNKQVKTPNIDQLIADGTLLDHAYNMGSWTGAVCMASRAMIISGRSVWNAEKYRFKWSEKDSSAINATWPILMENAGYETYMSGKWHVDVPAERIFNNTKHIRRGMPRDFWSGANVGSKLKNDYKKGLMTYEEVMPKGYNRPLSVNDTSWLPADTKNGGYYEGGKHWSEVLKDDAVEFLGDASTKDKPFFMYLAFNAAHDPRQSPQEYVDMYPLEDIELPSNFAPDYPFHEEIEVGPYLRDEALAPFPRTELAVKTHLQEYYAIITHMDQQIGEILAELDKKGLRENTLIMLTADHGLAVGRHGLMGKQNMYDHSMRVPLVIAGPGIPKGKVVEEDVFLQDVMPTALEVANVEKPGYVEFNSLLDKVKSSEPVNDLGNGVYGAYTKVQRMIRKDGFKLIVYPKANKILLFDLKNDADEVNNLADEPSFKPKVKQLFKELQGLQKHYDDNLDLSGVTL